MVFFDTHTGEIPGENQRDKRPFYIYCVFLSDSTHRILPTLLFGVSINSGEDQFRYDLRGRFACEPHGSQSLSCKKHCRCFVVGLLWPTLLQSGRSWQKVCQSQSSLYESDMQRLWTSKDHAAGCQNIRLSVLSCST